jgi:hypothetical protein
VIRELADAGLTVSVDPSSNAGAVEEAHKLVRRLLAGYPNLGAHDPEGYIAALTECMSKYPLFAGQRTIFKVDEANKQFPPTEQELRGWLDDAVRPYRFSKQWETAAINQLDERDELQTKEKLPENTEPRGIIFTNYDEAVAAHGRPFGAFDAGRKLTYRG